MTKEWKILEIKSPKKTETEINELTKEGWEVEHVTSGNSSMAGDEYPRSHILDSYVFLSRKRAAKSMEELEKEFHEQERVKIDHIGKRAGKKSKKSSVRSKSKTKAKGKTKDKVEKIKSSKKPSKSKTEARVHRKPMKFPGFRKLV